ncbi:hypothetical protein V496_01374 [Pseudogymnoascus sp. VKM F-4515 (FW-2607)]|nr:hypothetical protein V496_01374 [Pseudogymnoascus sp. VKM F-4515 (FW-2607)]
MQIKAQSSASASVNEDIQGGNTNTKENIVPLNTIFREVLGISNAIDEILLEHRNQIAEGCGEDGAM